MALVKQGVSAEKALEVINASSGRSNATENLIPQRVLTRAFPKTFALGLLVKDLGIAMGVLDGEKAPSPSSASPGRSTRWPSGSWARMRTTWRP